MSAISQPAGADEPKEHHNRKTRKRSADGDVRVVLEHARWRHGGWAGFGVVFGVAIALTMGVVAQGLGALLVVLGIYNAVQFVRTLRNPAGVIHIGRDRAKLPVGLCRGKVADVPTEDIRHAFFLRRAVSWTRSTPLLVIETDTNAFTYPRDWFASEADQRRIVDTLHKRNHPGDDTTPRDDKAPRNKKRKRK